MVSNNQQDISFEDEDESFGTRNRKMKLNIELKVELEEAKLRAIEIDKWVEGKNKKTK